MNKYREEYEKRTGQKAKTPNNSAFKSSYVTEIESKLEQAEKSRNHFTKRYKYMCKREKDLEGEIQKQKSQLEQAEKEKKELVEFLKEGKQFYPVLPRAMTSDKFIDFIERLNKKLKHIEV